MTGRNSPSSQSMAFKITSSPTKRRDDVKDEIASSSNSTKLFSLGQNVGAFVAGSETVCQICGDKATGRHYGAISCDGCKGFFRRSIRKRQTYQCRHQKMCSVDRDKRNQCRYCRLQKCIRIGMKQEAVQSERDRISSSRGNQQPPPAVTPKPEQGTMLSVITNAELIFHQGPLASSPLSTTSELLEAGVDELLTSMKEQVLLLVQWAKRFPSFMQLAVDDQICLLKAHASEHLLFGVTRRSRNQNYLLLGNNYIISRQSPENSFALIAARVLDQFLAPYTSLNVDNTEYACLKAIVFFDPYAEGLQARNSVFNMRQEIIVALYTYIRDSRAALPLFDSQPLGGRESSSSNQPHSRPSSPPLNISLNSSFGRPESASTNDFVQDFTLVRRFGELLLLVPTVRSIAEDMVDHIKFYKLFGAAKVDNVLHELLLGDTANDDNIQPVPAVASSQDSQPASYPSSGSATPALCNPAAMGPSKSEMYTPPILPQSGFPVSSISSSPPESSFDTPVAPAVATSSFNGSFGVLEPCMPPPINLLAPQQNGGSPLTQSPGLSALAAAAFVASQSMNNQATTASFSSNSAFLSSPADHYTSAQSEREESPTILAVAFSDRPPIPLNPPRRPNSHTPPIRSQSTLAVKPVQTE